VVSTPYMDEAERCDRVALIQAGRILGIDPPSAIVRRYPRPLLAVRARDRYRLIRVLREMPDAYSVFPFGETLHYADRRERADAAVIAAELHEALTALDFHDVAVAPIDAGIEDSFMALMRSHDVGEAR